MPKNSLPNNERFKNVKHNIILDEMWTQFHGELPKSLSLTIGEWAINNQTGELRKIS